MIDLFQEVAIDDMKDTEEIASSPDGEDGEASDVLASRSKHRLRRKSDPALPADVAPDEIESAGDDASGDHADEDIHVF